MIISLPPASDKVTQGGREAAIVPDQPLVSVIVATYNGERFIRAAIESVLSQTYPMVECIAVDDGSTDTTPEILASFGSRIRTYRQPNQGYVRARNNAARLARGSLLSFLDHDDWWRPTKLERQVRRLAERPESAVIYTAVELIDENDEYLGVMPAPPRELAFRNTILMKSPILALEQGALIRRGAFDELGGFDEQLSTSIGCDLACRFALDYVIEPLDEPLAAYRKHSQQMSRDLTAIEHDMRIVHARFLADDRQGLARDARYNLHVLLARWYWQRQKRPGLAVLHATRAALARPGRAGAGAARRAAHLITH